MSTKEFVRESNRIEGILRPPRQEEIDTHNWFMSLPKLTVEDVEKFVRVYQPVAVLRDRAGLDVTVGIHVPPTGSPYIREQLTHLLSELPYRWRPFEAHCQYENLHPFTDCNGRSGRAIWAWHMLRHQGGFPLGFLHTFYYQSLQGSRTRG
jgi:fido (protein-threonine AMPylation protein)